MNLNKHLLFRKTLDQSIEPSWANNEICWIPSFTPFYADNIYLFKVNNRNTKKRCKARYFYCWPWTNFTPFSSVYIADFEQINVSCLASKFQTYAFSVFIQLLYSLREKCPNMEVLLVRIFPYSVRMRKNTDQKKLCIWTLFHAFVLVILLLAQSVFVRNQHWKYQNNLWNVFKINNKKPEQLQWKFTVPHKTHCK